MKQYIPLYKSVGSQIGIAVRMTLLSILVMSAMFCHAAPAISYAGSSRLASGHWVKIEVREEGIQLITTTALKDMGFTDPEKVNVYGYGGRMLPEFSDSDQIDDLPLIPSMLTSRGILFFGHSSVAWDHDSYRKGHYTHSLNPYSDKSFYFLSDADLTHQDPDDKDSGIIPSDPMITSFTERLVHEQDILAPSNTGRLMLGEDFRIKDTRSFQFDLPGNISDVDLCVRFGAKVTNGTSSLLFTANGNRLPATSSDKISGVNSAETFLSATTTSKRIENCGEKLNLTIQYSHSGALFTAALDYIRISYTRELKLHNDELYFYIYPEETSNVVLEGCGTSTYIWDVTDPLNPLDIKFDLSGTTATFPTIPGYHEYIAFDAAKVSRTPVSAGFIPNQDLHSAKAPGLLIISPDEYVQAARKIAEIHEKSDGLSSLIVSPEMVYNEFSSGTPDVTAFRKLLKMWRDRSVGNSGDYTHYCLILSRPTYDNKMNTQAVGSAGYPRVPIWQSPSGMSESTSYSCDDYIGMLDDFYPGMDISNAEIHVAVGRMPVKNASEAMSAANKLEKYMLEPQLGSWRNNVMVIADDQDNGVHLDQAQEVCSALVRNGSGKDYVYERLYLDAYPLSYSSVGPIYTEAKQRMMDKLTEGVVFLNYIGHANPKSWGHENLLTWNDITSMKNTRLPFLYAATCEFMRWDADDTSGAEEMWLNPSAGVIAMICPSRTVYISLNGTLNSRTSEYVFRRDSAGNGMRIGDIMTEGKNAQGNDNNKLRYALMGDPAMRLPAPGYHVELSCINDNDLSDPYNLPVIAARSKVRLSGIITDGDGNKDNSFSGTLDIQLYDAEKVITTKGNGENGKQISYNDRKTRLFIGKTLVKDGSWQTEINLPAEIENNYSPALLSFYAASDSGKEANGSYDKFYVYGYNPDAAEDTEGPEISSFYLNAPSFTDGSTVSPSPVAKANFSDISGINISEAGIGHNMMIRLDDNRYFNDVDLYYSPDASDPCSGEISYPLQNIEPGEHTLQLTIWDNANNSSTASLTFKVAADWKPSITELYTDVNPASSNVNFIVASDMAGHSGKCTIEVFDLSGQTVWRGIVNSSGDSAMYVGWDLCDSSGARVPRGIYPYRAIITDESGIMVTKSGKLAVTAK